MFSGPFHSGSALNVLKCANLSNNAPNNVIGFDCNCNHFNICVA